MSYRSLVLCLFLLPLTAVILVSQEFVRGTVQGVEGDTRVPLRGASLRWKGTQIGTLATAEGLFVLRKLASTDTLEVRMAGYQPSVLKVTTDTLNVVLLPTIADAVTVEAEAPTITRALQKTEVISSADLRKAACCSLAESFEKNPSVEVSFADPLSGARQIQLLGLRGLYTQVLVEAVPLIRSIEIPYGLDHVPGPFMESISISKGASTVTNGYESMTGQINVCMHDPHTAPSLFVNVYGNTMTRFEANLYSAFHITDELSTMTMVHGRIMDMAFDFNKDGFADIPTFRQFNIVHRWRYNDDAIEWQAYVRGISDLYEGGQSVLGHKAVGADHVDSTKRPYDVLTSIGRIDGFVKFGILDLFGTMAGSGLSFVLSGAHHDQSTAFGLRSATGFQQTFQARGILALPFSDVVKVVGGVSYLYDDVRERIDSTAFTRLESVPGVYAEATLQPFGELTILAGLRADAHNLYGTRLVPRAHVKWNVSPFTAIRASLGRGWRVASVVSENIPSYINARNVMFDATFLPEDSWNGGLSFTSTVEIAERPITLDAEVFHTVFSNQVVIDFDRSARELWVTNLRGVSYATNVLVQVLTSPLPRLDLLLAYRWVDVQAPYGGSMQQRPMMSRSRILTTASYSTEDQQWQVDLTLSWNSGGRLPRLAENPVQLQRLDEFPAWWRVGGQITRRFGKLEVYAGVENANGFIQSAPIVAADNPYGPNFDASMAWGPLDFRTVYVGIRYTLE